VDLTEPVLQDLTEAEQDRQVDPTHLEPVDERLEIDALRRILVGVDEQMAVGPHGKVAIAPTGHFVEIGGIRRAPLFDVEIDCHLQPSRTGGPAMVRTATSLSVASATDQANSSLITLPELAIFIGRPFLAVNVVSSETPSDLSTLAITSWEV